MQRITFLLLAGLIGSILLPMPVAAQAPAAPPDSEAATPKETPVTPVTTAKVADVEAALQGLENNGGLDEPTKNELREIYTNALEALRGAAENANNTKRYRESITTAPAEAEASRQELQALPSASRAAEVEAKGEADELERDVMARRATLAELQDQLTKVSSQLANSDARAVAISTRVPEAKRELSEVEEQLKAPEPAGGLSPRGTAEKTLRLARQAQLTSELEMLAQEQLSESARTEQLRAQQELLTRKVENETAALGTLQKVMHERLMGEAKRVTALVEFLIKKLPEDDEAAQQVAAEVRSLALEYEGVVENLERAEAEHRRITQQTADLTADFDSIREQVGLAGGGMAMVQVLQELRSRVLNASAEMDEIDLPALDKTRLASIQVGEKLRQRSAWGAKFEGATSADISELVDLRVDILRELQEDYSSLLRPLSSVAADKRLYLDKAEEIGSYVKERLFGFDMKSCPSLGLSAITELPGGLWWAFGSAHWQELGQALWDVGMLTPVLSVLVLVVSAALLLLRPWLRAALLRTGTRIKRISTDHYSHTTAALVWSFLLGIPLTILFGHAGWLLNQAFGPSDWLRGVTQGISSATAVVFVTGFTTTVCLAGGLGDVHFGWRSEVLKRLRRAIRSFAVVYVPTLVITYSCFFGDASQYFQSVGRISFLVAHVWMAHLLWRTLQGPNGILAIWAREEAEKFLTRWRLAWLTLLMACPISLIVLACMGYLITASQWSLGLIQSGGIIAAAMILNSLVLRWFMIKQRKLALAEAIEKRRARREAAQAEGGEAGADGEVVSVDADEEEGLDLESISDQTRALLRLLSSVGALVAIIIYWSKTFPLIEALESTLIPLTDGLTLLAVVQALVVVAVTYVAVQNLPGLLELAVLRATEIAAGTRHAIATLCRYGVIAIGAALVFNVLQVDWAKFGWIAAALSVGLGFGLQEVVANFVCGLILLFERPIRVGDIVTVDGTTGTVTRIHMRATTITNWDRQDFVVPNKNLITGTILNWTLSAPLNRVVIPVGVAYGTDTDRARNIMLEVAADHPRILEDPGPSATFEQFADSSLNLILRAYLPDLDNRLTTISELHSEIDKRFAAAGIEIPFPQQDLHLRSGWEKTQREGETGEQVEPWAE